MAQKELRERKAILLSQQEEHYGNKLPALPLKAIRSENNRQ